ncbi:MAG: hypothetical protein ACTSRE_13950 [Promethearchaeota archaeon]
MGISKIDSTKLHKRLLNLILTLGIFTFISSTLGSVKYSILAHWFQTGFSYGIELSDPYYMMLNFAVNLAQRIPILFIWIILAYCIVNLYRYEDKLFKTPSIFVASIIGVLSLSVILLTASSLSLLDFSFRMLLGQLEPDFFLLLIANVLELLIWLRLHPYMEISPYLKKKQKNQVALGIFLLIFAVSVSLLLKAIFLSNELAIGFSLLNFYPYHTRLFGILAGVEILKGVLYLIGGLIVGIYREKRVKPDKVFTITEP